MTVEERIAQLEAQIDRLIDRVVTLERHNKKHSRAIDEAELLIPDGGCYPD